MVMNLARRAGFSDSGESQTKPVIPFPVTLSSLLFLDGWKWDAREMSGVTYVGGPPVVSETFETPGFMIGGVVHLANSIDAKNVTYTISVGRGETVFTYSTSAADLYFDNTIRSDTSMVEVSLDNFSDFMIQPGADFPGTYDIHANFSPPLPYESGTATVTITPPSVSLYPSSVTPPPIVYLIALASISITDPETFVKQLDASTAVEEGVKRALLPFATKLV